VPDFFRHLDRRGTATGWLCPPPHLTLAEPAPDSGAQPPPAPRRPAAAPAAAPGPRRKPTPIPPLRAREDAPREWPPATSPVQWWENP
jgi:hypothetical protein